MAYLSGGECVVCCTSVSWGGLAAGLVQWGGAYQWKGHDEIESPPSPSGQVTQGKPWWTVEGIIDLFWSFLNFIVLL